MKNQLSLTLLLCAFVSIAPFVAAQTATGSAVIPPYTLLGGTNLDRDVKFIVSNITGSNTDVEITFYSGTGSIIYESSSSPTAGRILYSAGYVSGTYTEGTSSGPSVSFTIAANSTVVFTLSTLHPGNYDEYGYGIIRWTKYGSNEVHSIVARGMNNMALGSAVSESTMTINSCLPF